MAINTEEIELHSTALTFEKLAKESPRTLAWILHNFSVIKDALASGSTEVDVDALNAQLVALQAALTALQAELDAIVIPAPFDPSALQAAIDDLQAQIDALPPPPFIPPPFVMPGGNDGDVLTHGPGGMSDFFFQSPCAPVLAVPDGFQISDEKCGTIFVGL